MFLITPENLLPIGFIERDAPAGRSFHRLSDGLELIVFVETKNGIITSVEVKSNLSLEQLKSIENEILNLPDQWAKNRG